MSSPLEEEIHENFIPKKDVQQVEFLQRYPEYDGRGLLIAIIDGAIDVSLDGLQKTSTGLPKFIDCFDFSGAGDVDTSLIKKTGTDKTNLELLSGKKIIEKREEEQSSEEENKAETIKPKEEEIFERINFFDALPKNDIVDCIVWNDGKIWCTCIVPAASAAENIENVKVLTNFRNEHEYCFIFDNISCCATIKNEGNLLELFIPLSGHGSYVAQVAAAHYPSQPEKDGLAPGAQIISMNVMNECNNNKNIKEKAIEKALNKCVEVGVDMVNISVSTKNFRKCAVINLIKKKMVIEHKIIITQAAGNYGPFISSLRVDTNNSNDEMFTIGSLFTSDQKLLFGELNDNSPACLWYYSSKGPLPNGARGVTFVAPGGAVVKTPRWHPSIKRSWIGTSCASPIAAGAIACLMAALKANSIPYCPGAMKLALTNTACLPNGGDQLGFGNGIIQINSAFEYFKSFKTALHQKIILPQISINKSNKKGIVFYNNIYNNNMNKYCIKIENKQKQIPWILKLTPEEENQKHIEYSKAIKNNLFYVKIDSKQLKPGSLYYSELHGFDPSNLLLGPIFHFPITVIVPEKVINNYTERKIFVTPPSWFNIFIDPIKSCNKCTVKLQNSENDGKIDFQTTIKKPDYGNVNNIYCERKGEFTFRLSHLWVIKIRWENIFEIYIYQEVFIANDFELKSCLSLCFKE